MDGDRASEDVSHVVILSHDGVIADDIGSHFSCGEAACVRVENGYEAAAELMASHAVALVVDFRALPRRHLRLLVVARERGVSVLGVGSLPGRLSSEDLSGVQLVSHKDLSGVLGQLVRQAAGAARGATGEEKERPAVAGTYAPSEAEEGSRSKPGVSPQDLLTPEELDALFRNEL